MGRTRAEQREAAAEEEEATAADGLQEPATIRGRRHLFPLVEWDQPGTNRTLAVSVHRRGGNGQRLKGRTMSLRLITDKSVCATGNAAASGDSMTCRYLRVSTVVILVAVRTVPGPMSVR